MKLTFRRRLYNFQLTSNPCHVGWRVNQDRLLLEEPLSPPIKNQTSMRGEFQRRDEQINCGDYNSRQSRKKNNRMLATQKNPAYHLAQLAIAGRDLFMFNPGRKRVVTRHKISQGRRP